MIFKNLSEKNSTPFKVENEIHTHEDACGRQLVPHFVRNINIGLTENSSAYRQSAFKPSEFSQIAFGDFVKPYVKSNSEFCSRALKWE